MSQELQQKPKLFNGNQAKNTLIGLGIAVVVISQTFSFVTSILDRMNPKQQEQTTLSRDVSEMKQYTERLTKVMEQLSIAQTQHNQFTADISGRVDRVLSNQKAIEDAIGEVKKKVATLQK